MQVGSLVETVADFTKSGTIWGFAYPKKRELLVVAAAYPHHNADCARKGILLLEFEEYPGLIPISHKTVTGKANFIELVPPLPAHFYETEAECIGA